MFQQKEMNTALIIQTEETIVVLYQNDTVYHRMYLLTWHRHTGFNGCVQEPELARAQEQGFSDAIPSNLCE